MFKILSSPVLNVTTPIHWSSYFQCRCSTEEMTSPVVLFQHGMGPRPGVMGKKGHVLWLQPGFSQYKESYEVTSTYTNTAPLPSALLWLHQTRPAIICQSPKHQQKLSLHIYSLPIFTWTSSSHWEKPAQSSGKHISQQRELHSS